MMNVGQLSAQQSASTSLFRRLVRRFSDSFPPIFLTLSSTQIFDGTVPIEIKLDLNELPANSDRSLEYYYVRVALYPDKLVDTNSLTT